MNIVENRISHASPYFVSDELLHAIWSDDMDKLNGFLKKGIHPKTLRQTPLLRASILSHAASMGRLRMLRRLLDELRIRQHTADFMDYCNGRTALHVSAVNGNAECTRELVQYGINLNLADVQGSTALLLASSFGHSACVEILLAGGACVTLCDRMGASALHYSTYSSPRLDDVSRLLIKAGCLSNRHTYFGMGTPLSNLLFRKNTDMVKFLISSGYNTKNDQFAIDEFIQANEDHPISEYLIGIKNQPKCLFSLCKIVIVGELVSEKNSSKGHLKDKIHRLPIPGIIMRDIMIS